MATEKQKACLCCGGTDFEEDSAHGVVACMTCGTAVERELTHVQEPSQISALATQRSLAQQPSKQQICMFSDKRYAAKKLAQVIKQTMKMAETMKLPQAKAVICVEQAKELARRHAIGKKGLRLEYVSAALVYIAWKNENACVSAQDMVNTGVKPSAVMKVANKLCTQHPDLLSISLHPHTEEERLNLRLDRFSAVVVGEERRKVVEVAMERKLPINDYTILAVALQYIRRRSLTRSELSVLAENISMTTETIRTRLWVVKKALVTLASRCPWLEEDVKNRVISTYTVHRFLDRLIQNKKYLISEVELMNEEEDESEEEREDDSSPKKKRAKVQKKRLKGGAVHHSAVPVVLANGQSASLAGGGYTGTSLARGEEEEEVEEEDDVDLSDLDDEEVEEYLLTEEEVKIRRYLLSSEDKPQ